MRGAMRIVVAFVSCLACSPAPAIVVRAAVHEAAPQRRMDPQPVVVAPVAVVRKDPPRMPMSKAPELERVALASIERRIHHGKAVTEGDADWANVGAPLRVALEEPRPGPERASFMDSVRGPDGEYHTRHEEGRIISGTAAFQRPDETCVLARVNFWQLWDGFRYRTNDMRASLSSSPVAIACDAVNE
jgi:hypothetical protein